MVSPIDSVEAPGEPPTPDRCAGRADPGAQPLVSGVAAAAAQQGCAGVRRAVRPDRAVLPGGAAVGRARGAHRAEREPHHRHGDDRRAGDRRRRARRHTAGAGTARQVSARRRPERPRRHGAVDVRRPDFDLRRSRGGTGDDDPCRHRRLAGRLLPRLDRRGAVAGHGRHLGLSRAAARYRIGHHAGHRRPQGRARSRSRATRSGYRS